MKKVWLVIFAFAGGLLAQTGSGGDLFEKMQSQIIEASNKVKDRVVHIEVIMKENQRKLKIQGSGLILDSAGFVITNDHVVDKAEKITISVSGLDDKLDAIVLGTDKMTDLALLKLEHPLRFSPVSWANVDHARVGDWAIAIGNPYGLDRTVSLGIVSAKGRAVPAEGILNEFLQTDAMIDVGSSGGPLINLKGEVLGINSMMIGRGIGFTVPADIVQQVINKLKKSEEIERSWIGIGIQPLTHEHAEYFGIPDKKGVIVTGVFENSPAEKGGFQSGNIIISVNGKEVGAEKEEDLNSFKRMISDFSVGETVLFEVYDIAKKKFGKIKVKTDMQPTAKPKELDLPWGFLVKEITPILHRENFLFSKEGVVVSYVRNGSEAEIAGLSMWDIVLAVDDYAVKNINDFEKAYKKAKGKEKVMLRVLRNRDTFFILLQKYRSGDEME